LLPLVAAFGCIGGGDITLPEERQTPPGSAEVSVATTGVNLDPDGYEVTIDESRSQHVDVNGSVVFTGLAPRDYQVVLAEVADNCAVQGTGTQGFIVISGETTLLAFAVVCS
jgi:hypothetical protein